MTFDPTSIEFTCATLPKDRCVQLPWKYIIVCGYNDPISKTLKGQWPLDDLWPQFWGHMYNSTQWSLCPTPMEIHQSVWIQWPFFENFKYQWLLDDLWPNFCSGHMTLTKYHCVQVPCKYIKVWQYSDHFSKTLKGHWPLHNLWPHIRWGHMCDSTQGSLSLTPMKIHQSVWIQWPFIQKL